MRSCKSFVRQFTESVLLSEKFNFFIYRKRFLAAYIVYCSFAILCEFCLVRFLVWQRLPGWVAKGTAMFVGILIAHFLNAKLNFRIPPRKRNRALLWFTGISVLSLFVNYLLRRQIASAHLNYEQSRLVISGILFIFAYMLHVRFSFRDRKKVGVAIYANGVEDIGAIYRKIRFFPDFIHIDIIDRSFRADCEETDLRQIDRMRKQWPGKEIHAHIMSKRPSQYLPGLLRSVDLVCIHTMIDENIGEVIANVKNGGVKAGLCLIAGESETGLDPFWSVLDIVMLLSISAPGFSGQQFDTRCYDLVDRIGRHPRRGSIALCVDGGVNESNIRRLRTEYVVSGSSVLNNPDPSRQIMRLQTSSEYEL